MSWFVCFLMSRQPRKSQRTDTLLPYPPRFRSAQLEDLRIPARRRTLTTAALEDLICQGRQQRLLVGEVVIERGGLYAELTAQATHRQVSQRSEEHTSELQSLMRISYAVFCLKKKKTRIQLQTNNKDKTVR